MLNSEKQEVIQGCIVYQDYSDTKSFYCLPEEKAKIADNGKALQYVVYTDGEIVEGSSPDFSKDESRVGGFLTLQVELGPSESKLSSIRNELKSKHGDDINLSMVPFKDGSVKLMMFSSDGSEDANTDDFKISIAGSTKPSLQLKQTAVFSTRLSNTPAQIMWNLLKKEGQTQVAVCYELDYYGIMKAYNLEIIVDFKATEDFWNHTLDLDATAKNKDLKIVSSADVDIMIRELINDGSIIVKQVVYAEGEAQSKILADDPMGIKLVKDLMGPTLFQATAIPTEDYSAAISEAVANRKKNEEKDADGDGDKVEDIPPEGEDKPQGENENREGGDGENAEKGGVDGTDSEHDRPKDETDKKTKDEKPGIETAEENEGEAPADTPPQNDDVAKDEPSPTVTHPSEGKSKGDSEASSDTADDNTETAETKTALGVDINVGYTLRRREISQQIKRKFLFTKAEAKTFKYYPNGALTLAETDFDAAKQLQLVTLNDDIFKKIELQVRASFDFDAYAVREVIVHISYGYKGSEGDRSKRLHEHSLVLTKEKSSEKIKFFVDQYRTLSYDYVVEFIHNDGTIIGTPETRMTSQVFLDETVRELSITMDTHSPLIPVEIQLGALQFADDGIQSVQVFLAPQKGGNGRTTIFNNTHAVLKRYFIQPPQKNQYDFYARQEFFFKNEKLTVEAENIKDSQIVIDTPSSQIFTIKPSLVTVSDLVKQALVEVVYTAADNDVKTTTLSLTPDQNNKEFSILVKEDDPRKWIGKSSFVLKDGRLFEGPEIVYNVAEPMINLDNSGFRTVQVTTLLGDTTFSGRIAAIKVTISSNDLDYPATETIYLNKSKVEGVIILPKVPITASLNAEVVIYDVDGSLETLNYIVPPNSSASNASQLMLNITTVN